MNVKLTSDGYEKSEDFTAEHSPHLTIKKLALQSFSMNMSWYNISEKYENDTFKLIEGDKERIITIPDGNYSVKGLNRYIIKLFGKDPPIIFGIIEERQRISFKLKKNYKMDLRNSDLHQLMGFKSEILNQEEQEGEYITDITHGNDNIYIHCDVIDGALVNNINSDVIYSFVNKTPPGSLISKDFNNLIFFPEKINNISRIRMRITNQNNELIDLNKGRVKYNLLAAYEEDENYLKKIYNLMQNFI
ncbi:hypothetical protein AVEN_22878-1 [Araneus ventricosus]|uniref:Uncharacterized protein n=1 Tax=Araneus ventricosus TaxID=182803 RepID=A0A4Y2IVG3_ARAVE|nr:hypothetical protein AVEN_22878-1 [Araneus ventricosus]